MVRAGFRAVPWCAFLVVAAFGCGSQTEERPVLSEQRFVASGTALKTDLGGDCAKGGTAECLSGICLHTLPGPHEGWVCSSRCSSSTQCPPAWACIAPHPDDPARVCVPQRASSK
jgi:hypothetical protein